jgi:hypothetical protein
MLGEARECSCCRSCRRRVAWQRRATASTYEGAGTWDREEHWPGFGAWRQVMPLGPLHSTPPVGWMTGIGLTGSAPHRRTSAAESGAGGLILEARLGDSILSGGRTVLCIGVFAVVRFSERQRRRLLGSPPLGELVKKSTPVKCAILFGCFNPPSDHRPCF